MEFCFFLYPSLVFFFFDNAVKKNVAKKGINQCLSPLKPVHTLKVEEDVMLMASSVDAPILCQCKPPEKLIQRLIECQ
jgi:hypothetical protein